MFRTLCLYLILASPGLLSAQFFFRQANDIPVNLFQNQLSNAWAGGLNAPQFSSLDLNGDGSLDLLVFDREGNRILPMLRQGTPLSLEYRFAPEYLSRFPQMHDWVLSADYDRDGRYDLFTAGENGEIRVFKNISVPGEGVQFIPYPGQSLQTRIGGSAVPLLSNPLDIPALVDVNQDGALDCLVFDPPGSMIEYHQNQSLLLYGHRDSLTFSLVDACWGKFKEDGATNAVQLNLSCYSQGGSNGPKHHAGSTLLGLDLDNDGDQELLIGDLTFDEMLLLTNGGSPGFAQMISQSTQFPASLPVSLATFPAAYRVDVDGDGSRDLLVSPNATRNAENAASVWRYRNSGSDSLPNFSWAQDDFLQEEMLEFGSGAAPVLVDYNHDGLIDLLVGNFGYYQQGNFFSQVALFANLGQDSLPRFDLIAGDMANFGQLPYQRSVHPSLADIDADGDLDMLVGKADGTLDLYRNISTDPMRIFPTFILDTANYRGIDVGAFATPQLFDLNGDSLLDLIVGKERGSLSYWENEGSQQIPDFRFITDSLGGVQVNLSGSLRGFSVPHVFRYQDTLHLLVGSADGKVLHYKDLRLNQAFPLQDSLFGNIQGGSRVVPAVADLNQDGYLDLVLGHFSGGLTLYWGKAADTTSTSIENNVARATPFRLYPNPVQDRLYLEWRESGPPPVRLALYSLQGQLLMRSAWRSTLDLTDLAEGVYVLGVYTASGSVYWPRIWRKNE